MFNEAASLAITRTELDAVFFQNFEYDVNNPGVATAQTAAIFRPIQTEHSAWIQSVNKGSGLFPIIGETQSVPLSTPRVTNKQTTVIKDFAEAIEISKDLFDDNMHGVWAKDVADFAMVARITQDYNAFKLFRNATTTTLTADGVAWGSASHTLIGGGTTSNLLTTASLTPDNLKLAITTLRQQVNQAGVPMGNSPAYLVVPSPLFYKAIEYTESALIPDSAQNNVNVFRGTYGITVYTSIFLDAANGGSDSTWFLLGRNHAITRVIRQGIQTALVSWEYSNNRTYKYQANFREEVFVADYVASVICTA